MSRIDEALRRARGAAADTREEVNLADEAVLWELAEEPAPQPAPQPTLLQAAPAPARIEAPAPTEASARIEPPARIETPAADVLADPAPAGAAVLPAPGPASVETLVTGTSRRDAIEQYRKLAATLYHVQANRNIRVVLCSSAVTSEGKTVTAANLALTLSESYHRRVLLIDADLRRPRIHTLFGIPAADGLGEALAADADRPVNVVPMSPWLSIVTAGAPIHDPVHVLTSERLGRVIQEAGANFDWVIIDTPPVLVLPDAGLLMSFADAAVLVVAAGQTTYRMVTRAVEALGRERIIGVVMNRADDSVLEQSTGGYYGYYQTAESAR